MGAERTARVTYVGGAGRSGSTLLGRVVNEDYDAVAVGELVRIWTEGLIDRRLCNCGVPVPDCEFWTEVAHVGFGGWRRVDVQAVARAVSQVNHGRNVPFLLEPKLGRRGLSRAVELLTPTLDSLYRAIQIVSGAAVVLDGSKDAGYATLLWRASGIDLRVVHLVRDSRGVAYSWTKRVVRPDVVGRVAYMDRDTSVKASYAWLTANAWFSLMQRRGVPRLVQRYEDLVESPDESLASIAAFAGTQPRPTGDDGAVKQLHMISGNPMRFSTMRRGLRLDEQWRTEMPLLRRRVVTTLTLPGLLSYGYRLSGGRAVTGTRRARR